MPGCPRLEVLSLAGAEHETLHLKNRSSASELQGLLGTGSFSLAFMLQSGDDLRQQQQRFLALIPVIGVIYFVS